MCKTLLQVTFILALLGHCLASFASAGQAAPTDPKEAEQTKQGRVKRVGLEGRQLTVLVARELTFTVIDSTRITRDGKPWKLADIKAGDTVTVDYVRVGDTRTARKIVLAATPAGRLAPDNSFAVTFPDMPPTFFAVRQKKKVPAQMTVCLPTNYDPMKKCPLLIWLNGGDGGDGTTLGVARGITRGRDFICVSMPLFKASLEPVSGPRGPRPGFVINAADGKVMWPHFKTMLDKLQELVPNIDPAHRVLGGFSNGAHATAALIDSSDGEITRIFSAFAVVEGAGKLEHYEMLKGKPFLMVSSNAKSKPRAEQVVEAAKAAGARAELIVEDVGKHDFPVSAYPAVRAWLQGPGLE